MPKPLTLNENDLELYTSSRSTIKSKVEPAQRYRFSVYNHSYKNTSTYFLTCYFSDANKVILNIFTCSLTAL